MKAKDEIVNVDIGGISKLSASDVTAIGSPGSDGVAIVDDARPFTAYENISFLKGLCILLARELKEFYTDDNFGCPEWKCPLCHKKEGHKKGCWMK